MKVRLLVYLFVLMSASLYAQLADLRPINFHRADSIADVYFGEAVTDLPELSRKLTSTLSGETEKFRAIYKWVCNNIEFDYELFRINREKRDKFDSPEALRAWNKKLTPVVYQHLILEKKTLCTGYAWLVQQLAQHAGIACFIVDGYGRNATVNVRKSGKANHSWNAVMLNGKWYLCDPTWASGAYDADREVFVKNYDDSYFLADPKVFIRNHYPLDMRWTLLENQHTISEVTALNNALPSFQQFLNGPLIYSSAYRNHITELYPETLDIETNRNETINFRFSSDCVMERIEFSVIGPDTQEIVKPEFSRNEAGMYSLSHAFTQKGRHIVHVLLNKSYAFTYTVTVR
jgi:Transglutaminase-like superfamily